MIHGKLKVISDSGSQVCRLVRSLAFKVEAARKTHANVVRRYSKASWICFQIICTVSHILSVALLVSQDSQEKEWIRYMPGNRIADCFFLIQLKFLSPLTYFSPGDNNVIAFPPVPSGCDANWFPLLSSWPVRCPSDVSLAYYPSGRSIKVAHLGSSVFLYFSPAWAGVLMFLEPCGPVNCRPFMLSINFFFFFLSQHIWMTGLCHICIFVMGFSFVLNDW